MNSKLLFVGYVALNLILFVRSPVMMYISDAGAKVVSHFKIDPIAGITVAVLIVQSAVGLFALGLIRYFWHLRSVGTIQQFECSFYLAVVGLVLVYNLAVISVFIYLSVVND